MIVPFACWITKARIQTLTTKSVIGSTFLNGYVNVPQ
jgi:hypothetical protein